MTGWEFKRLLRRLEGLEDDYWFISADLSRAKTEVDKEKLADKLEDIEYEMYRVSDSIKNADISKNMQRKYADKIQYITNNY